jgi:tRNA A37 threonylcarbamoyladenosine biosynthesis protein TsaE
MSTTVADIDAPSEQVEPSPPGETLWFDSRSATSTLAILRTSGGIQSVAAQFIATEILQQFFGQSHSRRIIAQGFPEAFIRELLEQNLPPHFPRIADTFDLRFNEEPQGPAVVVRSAKARLHALPQMEGVSILQFITSNEIESFPAASHRAIIEEYSKTVVPELDGRWKAVTDWRQARIPREDVFMNDSQFPLNSVSGMGELQPMNSRVPSWYQPLSVSYAGETVHFSSEDTVNRILQNPAALTILFGPHGAGKTTLLARVAEQTSHLDMNFYAMATTAADWSEPALQGRTGRMIAQSITERVPFRHPNTTDYGRSSVLVFDGVDYIVRHNDPAVLERFAVTAAALVEAGFHVLVTATPTPALGLMQESLLHELICHFIEDEGRNRFRQLHLCPLAARDQREIARRFVMHQQECAVFDSDQQAKRYAEEISEWLHAATPHADLLRLPLWTVLACAHMVAHGVQPTSDAPDTDLASWQLQRIIEGEARRFDVDHGCIEEALERAAIQDLSHRLGIKTLTHEGPREVDAELLRELSILCYEDGTGSVHVRGDAVLSHFARKWVHHNIVTGLRRQIQSQVPLPPISYVPLRADDQNETSTVSNLILQHVRDPEHARSMVLRGEPGSGKTSVFLEMLHAPQAEDTVLLPLLKVMDEWSPTAPGRTTHALLEASQIADRLLTKLLGTQRFEGAFSLLLLTHRVAVLVDGFPRVAHDEQTRARINVVCGSLLELARLGVSIVVASLPTVEDAPNDPLRDLVWEFCKRAPGHLKILPIPPLSRSVRTAVIQHCIETNVCLPRVEDACQEFFVQLDMKGSEVQRAFGQSPYWLLKALQVLRPAVAQRLFGSKPLEMQRTVFVEHVLRYGGVWPPSCEGIDSHLKGSSKRVDSRCSAPPARPEGEAAQRRTEGSRARTRATHHLNVWTCEDSVRNPGPITICAPWRPDPPALSAQVIETLHDLVRRSLAPSQAPPVSRDFTHPEIVHMLERLGFIRTERDAAERKRVTFSANALREMWLTDMVRSDIEALQFVPTDRASWNRLRRVSQEVWRGESKDAVEELCKRFMSYDPKECNSTIPICMHFILVYHISQRDRRRTIDKKLRDQFLAHVRLHVKECYKVVQNWQPSAGQAMSPEHIMALCTLREGSVLLDQFLPEGTHEREHVARFVSFVVERVFAQRVLLEAVLGYYGGYEKTANRLCYHVLDEKTYGVMELLNVFELELIIRRLIAECRYDDPTMEELVNSVRETISKKQRRGGLSPQFAPAYERCREAVDEYFTSLAQQLRKKIKSLQEQVDVTAEPPTSVHVGIHDIPLRPVSKHVLH